jgi:hypothetical protein
VSKRFIILLTLLVKGNRLLALPFSIGLAAGNRIIEKTQVFSTKEEQTIIFSRDNAKIST